MISLCAHIITLAKSMMILSVLGGIVVHAQDAILVQDIYDHHTMAYNARNLTGVMSDYTEESVIRLFDFSKPDGGVMTFSGLQEIQHHFEFMFHMLNGTTCPAENLVYINDHVTFSARKQPCGDHLWFTQLIYYVNGTIMTQDMAIEEAADDTTIPTNSQEIYDLHSAAFVEQDMTEMLSLYTDNSLIRVFDFSIPDNNNTTKTSRGLAEIEDHYEFMFHLDSNASCLDTTLEYATEFLTFAVSDQPCDGHEWVTLLAYNMGNTTLQENIAIELKDSDTSDITSKTANTSSDTSGNTSDTSGTDEGSSTETSEAPSLLSKCSLGAAVSVTIVGFGLM